jgi:hypothetical protein
MVTVRTITWVELVCTLCSIFVCFHTCFLQQQEFHMCHPSMHECLPSILVVTVMLTHAGCHGPLLAGIMLLNEWCAVHLLEEIQWQWQLMVYNQLCQSCSVQTYTVHTQHLLQLTGQWTGCIVPHTVLLAGRASTTAQPHNTLHNRQLSNSTVSNSSTSTSFTMAA